MPVEAYSTYEGTLYINDVTDWDNNGYTIKKVLKDEPGLTSLIIRAANSENKIPANIFGNDINQNTQLKSVDIQDKNCIIEDYAFKNCAGIETLSLADGITIGRNAFGYCTSLQSVEIKGGEIKRAAFAGCTNLATVTIEDTTTMDKGGYNGYNQFSYCSGLKEINIISTDANNTKELLGKLKEIKRLDANDLSTINIKPKKGKEISPESMEEIRAEFIKLFGNEMNTNIDIKIVPTPGSDSNKEGKSSEPSATSTPATPAEVTFMLDSMNHIAKAKEGDTVIIDGRELGIHSYSLAFMKTIVENRKATIIMKHKYQGDEFEVTIPAGAKITLNEDIPWYGPLYIYSGALGKDVKINITAKK